MNVVTTEDADGDGGDKRRAHPKAALFEDGWRVVVHRVDAGSLLHDRQSAADQHHPTNPRDVTDHRERRALRGQGPLGVFDDRVELQIGLPLVQAQSEDATRLGQPALEPVPPRESGSTSMPSSSATAGTAATASIMRHTWGSWMT